jgi:UDP-glucose 4-epimerase
MKNYLVTGGAGFIGSHLIKRLLKEGNNVTTIDNLSTGFKKNIPRDVNFIKGDCGTSEVYKKLKKIKFDAIFHIAGQSSGEISFDNPIYDIKTNTISTILLLKHAIKINCKRFIFASTMSVYGVKLNKPIKETEETLPESFYGISKLASENYLRIFEKYGIKHTSLRLFNVYGPGQNMSNLRQGMVSIFMSQMINHGKIKVKGSSSRYRDFIYIDDVIEYFVRCLNNNKSIGKIINVGTGKKTYVSQIIKKLTSFNYNKTPVKYSGSTEGDINGIYANITVLKKTLGKIKQTLLKKGLLKMYQDSIKNINF